MKLKRYRQNLIITIIITIFFAVVFIAAVISPILFTNWSRLPFIGGFIDPSLHFRQFHKISSSQTWATNDLLWGMNTKLVALGSQSVSSNQDVAHILSVHQPGESITASVVIDENDPVTAPLTLTTVSAREKIILFYLPYFAGWACFLAGIWILCDKRWERLSLSYAVLCGGLGLFFFSWFDNFTTHAIVPLLYIGIAMASGALTQISVLLPRNKRLIKNPVQISFIGYPISLFIVGLGVFQLNQPALNILPISPVIILGVLVALSIFELVLSLFLLLTETLSPHFDRHAKAILGAIFLSILPYAIHLLVSLVNNIESLLNPLMFLPFCILPIGLVLLQKPSILPQENKTASTILIYLSLAFIFGIFYTIILFVLNNLADRNISVENPLILGSILFFTVLILYPIRLQIEKVIRSPKGYLRDKAFELAIEYSETLSAADNVEKAIQILYDGILEIIEPSELVLFLYDPNLKGFSTISPYHLIETPSLSLPCNANLAETLRRYSRSIYFQNNYDTNPDFNEATEFFTDHELELHVPIPGTNDLLGWISMGKRLNHAPYRTEEINLLESLATQFSLIYERSQTISALNHRLKEMEILNSIAISMNRTTDIDTLLISISKHLQDSIGFDSVSLVMKAEESEYFQRQFEYQNNEVITSSLNPINLDEDFPEKESILSKRRAFREDSESKLLILPLEINEMSIGALSLQSHSHEFTLDNTDLNLLSSIGNLITGAIIKTRLLQTSQAQANSLSILNHVSWQLSSTLVMDQLLETIVENAMQLLNASAGILILRQENPNDLFIEVTAGDIDANIRGKRVALVNDFTKEAFSQHKPAIFNNYNENDYSPLIISQVTEFKVKNLILAPLTIKGRVIGLVEIFNKNNNQLFSEIDKNFLEGFASQASIALNNVKLYTQTDQALEKRIEELSLMQQIDRELHSSSTLDSALQIMLRAAVSHTQAVCGTVALVDTFNNLVENIWQTRPGKDEFVSIDDLDLRDFVWFSEEMTDSYQIIDSSVSELNETLNLPLPCETHFLLHSKLEENEYVLLILHLESAYKLIESDIGFLARLNDHAGIALSNALLYDDLQVAVQSKNEFIGFISHELKNPLTAIKGHADILAKGMVGEINSEQEDFLRTISHNVKRMNTFITDLSDQSQIESKSLRITFESTSVNQVLIEVLQSYEQQFREKSITITQNFNSELPDIWCDRLRVIQVLSNLISNAIKYTPENGIVEIAAEYAINDWDQEGAAEVVHFWVKDNGYGIDESDQAHIFEKFFRGTSDNILKIPGTGLGLRISKTLVEMMGGTLWFESEVGNGSTFHFTIPI